MIPETIHTTESGSEFYTALVEVFHLPIKYYQKVEKYFLLHWEPQYLLNQWRPNGSIWREGIEYHIVNRTRGDIASWSHDPYVRLSFRKSADMNYGFVLIRRCKS